MTCRSSVVFFPAAPPAKAGHVRRRLLKPWKPGLLPALATALWLCGCHKNSEAKAPPPETTPAPAAAAPAAPPARGPVAQALPPSSQGIAANASAEEVAAQLSLELRRYVAYTRSIPKSFEDFVAHDPIKFPPPPAGKKFVISGGRVVVQ
jgi:hypothetical protein